MIDKVSKPIVTETAFKVRRAIQEAVPGSKREGFVYNQETGIGKTSHSTDEVQIDIVVTPKEVEPTGEE